MAAITFGEDIIMKHQQVGHGFIVEIIKNAYTLTVGVICIHIVNVSMIKMVSWWLRMRKDVLMNTRGRV